MTFEGFYNKNYKKLLFLMIGLLLLTLVYLFVFYQHNGDILHRDISLTGGTSVTIQKSADINDLRTFLLKNFKEVSIRQISDLRTGELVSLIIDVKEEPSKIIPALEEYFKTKFDEKNSSVEFTGSSLGQGFYAQLRFAVILAFVLMSLVVFILFRTFIPSLAVISCAFTDIVMTLAIVDMIGISISSAGIVAFLMLIGYSVDSDILLTTRVLKKKEGTLNQRIYGAFKTGLTMTLTAIVAVSISLVIVYHFSDVLRQIFTIILIGLFLDIINTWISNVSIIKWYCESKGIK